MVNPSFQSVADTSAYLRDDMRKNASTVEEMPSQTELARLHDRLATSATRFRDMLGVMEGRLDFVAGPMPQAPAGPMPVPNPPAQPGTIESLREVSSTLHDLCSRFDGELCRMMKIL